MSKYIYDRNIVGKHSVFNQKLSDIYDTPARNKVKQVLGDFVKDHPIENQQDLIITDEECKYRFLELQVCSNWIFPRYPYPYPYIFARKYKYQNDTLFLTLNKQMDKGYIFDAESFKNVKPRRLKKYSREFVYDIPWHRVLQVEMDSLDPDIIKSY